MNKHISLLLCVVAAGCQPATHPTRLAETAINNICHFNFDCCTPSERLSTQTFIGVGALNKAECIEELHDTIGGIFDAASAAVEAGTAVYNAEEAERCSLQSAVDSCDAQTVLGVPASARSVQLIFGVDGTDQTCSALAQRAFTTGTVKDGEACTSFYDCADFGDCVRGSDNKGVCVAAAKEGEACLSRGCVPGLVCGEGDVCSKAVLLDDGAACSSSSDCQSGACIGEGTCSNGNGSCTDNDDCSTFDFCDGEACFDSGAACSVDDDCNTATCDNGPVCGPASTFVVEICDGV